MKPHSLQIWPLPSHLPPYFAWSLKEVDRNTWTVGGRLVITRRDSETPGACWSDGKGGYFTATELPGSADTSLPSDPPKLSDGHPFAQLNDYQDIGAYWMVGDALLHVHRVINPKASPEHVILEAVRERTWSFRVPKVYYHGVHDGRYYIVYEKLPGDLLYHVWPHMKDEELKDRIFKQVARAMQELSTWRAASVSGVDGTQLHSDPLSGLVSYRNGCSNKRITSNCEKLGMDCSKIGFAHSFIWPGNIFVDSEGLVGLIDWMHAGFVPHDWIRTDLYARSSSGFQHWPSDKQREWIWGVDKELREMGFGECVENYRTWHDKIYPDWVAAGRPKDDGDEKDDSDSK